MSAAPAPNKSILSLNILAPGYRPNEVQCLGTMGRGPEGWGSTPCREAGCVTLQNPHGKTQAVFILKVKALTQSLGALQGAALLRSSFFPCFCRVPIPPTAHHPEYPRPRPPPRPVGFRRSFR